MSNVKLSDFEAQIASSMGYLGIFHQIGYIGDSLSSGEFVYHKPGDKRGHWDSYPHSWGKVIQRMMGIEAANYSSGGQTAKSVYNQADTHTGAYPEIDNLFDSAHHKPCYFLALGLNDFMQSKKGGNYFPLTGDGGWGRNPRPQGRNPRPQDDTPESYLIAGLGDPNTDIDLENYENNAQTYAGYYGKIIQRLLATDPRTTFFLVGAPNDHQFPEDSLRRVNAIIKRISEMLPNCFFIDLFNEAPEYEAEFYEKYFANDHMNPLGYVFTAKAMLHFTDKIILENCNFFKNIQFYGTEMKPFPVCPELR